MISGSEPAPLLLTSSEASTTQESGRRRTETAPAPIPTATAAVRSKPGRREARIPAAAPMKRAGKVGPPRKLPSEPPQERPLKRSSRSNAEIDQVAAPEVSPVRASWPEKRTSSMLLPVHSWKTTASRATAIPAAGGKAQERLGGGEDVGQQTEPHHHKSERRDADRQQEGPGEVGERRLV